MTDRRSCLAAVIVLLPIGLAGFGCASSPSGTAIVESREVDLSIDADGGLTVDEHLTVRFLGDASTAFSLTVPDDRVDQFEDVHASIGRPDAATGVGEAAVDASGPLVVRWTFPAVEDDVQEFVLGYRARGVLAVSGGRASLAWPIAPLTPPWPVVRQSVNVRVAGTLGVQQAPAVAGDGWNEQREGGVLHADASGLGPDADAAVRAVISLGTLNIAEPRWQYEQARALQMMPAFVSGGLFVLVIGIGAVIMLRVQYPDLSGAAREAGPVDRPSSITEAMATVLRERRLRSDPFSAGGYRVAAGASDPERSHTRMLAEILGEEAGTGLAPATVRRRLKPHRAALRRQLLADLVEAGLVDPERQEVVDGTRAAALVVAVFGVVSGIAVWFVLPRFGLWPIALPVGFVLSGLFLWLESARLTALTVAGEQARASLGPQRR